MRKTYLYVYPNGEVVTGCFPPATATLLAQGLPRDIQKACQQHLEIGRLYIRPDHHFGFDIAAQKQIGLFRHLLRDCQGLEVIG